MVDNRPGGRIFNLMVDKHVLPDAGPAALDTVFQALSDPTRRAMLAGLAERPRTVGELAAPFDISLAGASKHIQVLERAGLVRREVQGRTHTCHLEAAPLHAGTEWLRHYERFWNRKLDKLESLLRAKPRSPRRKP